MASARLPDPTTVLWSETMTDKTIDHDANEPGRGTALVATFDYSNPAAVFEKPETLDALIVDVTRKVRDFQHDMSTAASRKRTTALKMEVVKTKTALDEAGKSLNAGLRSQIDKVDEARRTLRNTLDELRDEAERPLREWEAAEAKKKEDRDRAIAELRSAGLIDPDETAEDLRARLDRLEAMTIDKSFFGEAFMEADGRREQAIAALRNGIARIEQAEKERAELEELRREKAKRDAEEAERLERERIERERLEEEARLKREAEEKERLEAERQQREKEAAEAAAKAEQERIARAQEAARKEAEERAARELRETEERAEKERLAQEERHAAELRRIEQEAATRQREAEAAGRRKTEEDRIAREAAEKRAANVKHRAKVMEMAELALVKEEGITEAQAKSVILAIANGRIPQVVIQF